MSNVTWNGTGQPAVGCEVEYKVGEKWCKCEVLAIKRGKAICWDDACGMSGAVELDNIRPIRTEEDKSAAEKIWAAMDEVEQLLLAAGFTRNKKAP